MNFENHDDLEYDHIGEKNVYRQWMLCPPNRMYLVKTENFSTTQMKDLLLQNWSIVVTSYRKTRKFIITLIKNSVELLISLLLFRFYYYFLPVTFCCVFGLVKPKSDQTLCHCTFQHRPNKGNIKVTSDQLRWYLSPCYHPLIHLAAIFLDLLGVQVLRLLMVL